MDERQLDAVFMALADPTRRGIVARLASGEATVKELAEPYAMSMQAVSQHIRVLEQSGLISRRRYRQTRPCRLEPAVLEAAVSWIEESRRTWTERMDRLESHLARLQEQEQEQRQERPAREPAHDPDRGQSPEQGQEQDRGQSREQGQDEYREQQ